MTDLPSTSAHQGPWPEVEDLRWTAVSRRDRSADGLFVYAVATTGVFCQPSCPSRRPLRRNVRFYVDAAAAEAHGFRACRRCIKGRASRAAGEAELIARACRMIEEAQEIPRLEMLSSAAGLSASHFHRLFSKITGVTPRAYAEAHRSRRVRSELATSASITEAFYNAGFGSSGRFYERSTAMLGMTPSAFRNGGVRTCIKFAVGQTSLGSILVAASDKGICNISLGDDPSLLVRELEDRFPASELLGAEPDFEELIAKVVGHVEMPQVGLALPLDVRGTAFQCRVWQALRCIPFGSTVNYSQLAVAIGVPKAARAVASACAANVIAIAIPCHRVIRSGGGLGGYRWGVERKHELLSREVGQVEQRQ